MLLEIFASHNKYNVWLPKCNEMGRMYCFAYDIVDTLETSGIEPEKKMNKQITINIEKVEILIRI